MAQSVQVIGTMQVHRTYGEQVQDLSLVIVEGSGPALPGRDWFTHIRLD